MRNYIITCNKCGDKSTTEEYSQEGFQSLNTDFGYGSCYDSQRWTFELCDQCLTDIIKTFKYVPEGFGESGYYAVYPQIMFEHWKETGEFNLEAGMSKEEIESRGGSIYMEIEEDEN